jgi:hypothetical protein
LEAPHPSPLVRDHGPDDLQLTKTRGKKMPNNRDGHKDWHPWSFDYSVSDSEGLSILNGRFHGLGIFGKLSLPVIRVKYLKDGGVGGASRQTEGSVLGGILGGIFGGPAGVAPGAGIGHAIAGSGTGPFADQITWNKGKLSTDHGLQRISNRNNEYVGLLEYMAGRTRWLEISIYARIGAYHLAQQWHLSETGQIEPRLWSKGLTINMDHTHHAYWRLDFDIDGSNHNRVYLHDDRGWSSYLRETNDVKHPDLHSSWFVRNERTGRGAWIMPHVIDRDHPEGDGHPDGFSGIDMGVRLFHANEETHPWPFGTNGLGFLNNEAVADADVVFWYVAHMFHRAAEGGDHWHNCGPTIQVHTDASGLPSRVGT